MKKNKKAFVCVTNDLLTDNRVDKVCNFLVEKGFDVTLVGRQRKSSLPLNNRNYTTKRLQLWVENGPKFYAEFSIRLFLYLLFKRQHLIVSNDLDTLLPCYALTKFKPSVDLVYDSHEYFTEVPELINRPKVQKVWEAIEIWIFPKLKKVYTVNASIAKMYADKYKKKVEVVRNISPMWQPKEVPSKQHLGIPEGKFLVILQGAGINIDRGAEEAVQALALCEGVVLMIVGDGDVVLQLKQYVTDHALTEKVLFFGKRPYAEMMYYTHYASVGLTLDKATNVNYANSLPNKVFDYMHATTPIICTPILEVKTLVKQYEIGTVLSELTPSTIAHAIQRYQSDSELLHQQQENCKNAAQLENWEHEKVVLNRIYAGE
jgi:glycosyltransferase involved in cell wall biosynthesis